MNMEEKRVNVFGFIRNQINAALGYQQTFDELISKGDIPRAISMMYSNSADAEENLQFYKIDTHRIMDKKKVAVRNKKGEVVRYKDVNKISVPYQKYINEVALVFLYGKPVIWNNVTPNPYEDELREIEAQIEANNGKSSPELDERISFIEGEQKKIDGMFEKYKHLLHSIHFDSVLREAKRTAGAEGSSAILFHTYQDTEIVNGKTNIVPRLKLKQLSKEKGDSIYTLFDQYGKLVSFAWGYKTKEANAQYTMHYDIFKDDVIYECEQNPGKGWKVVTKPNIIGKIPVIVMIQDVEWDGCQALIERIELSYSKNADVNDSFADPAMVATAEVLNQLPEKGEDSKLFVLKNGGKIEYLERNGNNEIRSSEIKQLDDQVMSKSFTPDISIDALKGLGNASGTTLHQIMTLANIKADRRKETHDEYLDRFASLVLTIMERVLYISDNLPYTNMVLEHQFQEPFGDTLQRDFDNLLKQFGAGGCSKKTFVEKSYLIKNPKRELELMRKEQEEYEQKQREASMMDVFGSAE